MFNNFFLVTNTGSTFLSIALIHSDFYLKMGVNKNDVNPILKDFRPQEPLHT